MKYEITSWLYSNVVSFKLGFYNGILEKHGSKCPPPHIICIVHALLDCLYFEGIQLT